MKHFIIHSDLLVFRIKHLFHYHVCLLISSGLNCGRFWQQSQCHNTWHLIHSLNPTAIFWPSTFSPVRLTSRYVFIQENRAFRKAPLMMLTSQKARKYATFQPLFIFPWQQTDHFHMLGKTKHLHWLDLPDSITFPGKVSQITGQSFRVAGNVYHPVRV